MWNLDICHNYEGYFDINSEDKILVFFSIAKNVIEHMYILNKFGSWNWNSYSKLVCFLSLSHSGDVNFDTFAHYVKFCVSVLMFT